MSSFSEDLEFETANWLQNVIRDDEVDYGILAESFMNFIKFTQEHFPQIKEISFSFSDGFKCFKAYCRFEDEGEMLSSIEIISI